MIRVHNCVPEVYYQQSRDFQFIGRLYELVLNSVKTNSELINALTDSTQTDAAFLELLSTTLGFHALHNYNVNQLRSICSCFIEIIKNKGSIKAIEQACNALVGAEGIVDGIYIDDSNIKKGLILYVSQELSDTSLLRDLMDYILPAGLTYSIIKVLKVSEAASTEININDQLTAVTHPASKTSTINSTFSLSDLSAKANLDSAGMLINSTIIDRFGYELQPCTEMLVPNTNNETIKIILTHGYFAIPNSIFISGGTCSFDIHCDSGYTIKNNSTNSIWFKKTDSTEVAFNMSTTNISITQSTQDMSIYTITINEMPDYNLTVIAEII